MKKIAILVLMTCLVQFVIVSLWAVNTIQAKPFSISSKTANTMEVQFNVPEYTVEEETIAGTVYNKIKIAEAGYLSESGMPELPIMATSIAIPNHGQVQVDLLDTHQQVIQQILPYPSQDGNIDNAARGLSCNQAFYQGADSYPQEIIKYSDPQILRDFRIITVQIQPFAWNALTHELIVRDRVNFQLRFDESTPGENELEGTQVISYSFRNIYEANILNFDDFRNAMTANTPPKYLIIYGAFSDPTFQSKLNDFVFWKKQKGADIRLLSTSVTGSTTTSIKSYIQNIYNDVNARPDYIILIGDTNGSFPIPTWTETYNYYDGKGDYPYTHLAGTDKLGDVFIGRISAESTSQLDVIFSKVYAYEKNINVATAQWLNKMLLVGDTTTSTGYSPKYICKYIKELAIHYNPDYTFIEQYEDANAGGINQALNLGVGIMNFRGYIDVAGWTPPYSLVNGTKMPHIVFLTCGTGSFDNTTGKTEELLRLGSAASPQGAVTAIGMDTSHTNTLCNNTLNIGIFSGIFTYDMRSMGEALLNGKLLLSEMYNQYLNTPVTYSAHWCNLMGDPTMEVYCKIPNTFTSNAPTTMPQGSNTLNLTIFDQNSIPVKDASVTVSQNNLIIAKGYTDSSGRIFFNLTVVLSSGNAVITVSKHEFKPLQHTIVVDNSGTLVASTTAIDDDNLGASTGNSNFAANSGETLEVLFSIRNTTSNAIGSLTGYITSSNPYITIIDSALSFSQVEPGASVYALMPVLIHIAPTCPNYSVALFDMHLNTSADSVFNVTNFINITDAYMSFISYLVNDGNNHALEPNESSSFNITLKNYGTVPINDLYGQLMTQNDMVLVQDNIGYFGSLLAGTQLSTAVDSYQLLGRDSMLPGMLIPLRLKLYNSVGFQQWIDFTLTVGVVTSRDPLGPDAYGYVIYDVTDTSYVDCPTYQWVGIAPAEGGSGTVITLSDTGNSNDEGDQDGSISLASVTLPFQFKFYGDLYSQITVCSNGFLAFGSTENFNYRNTPLPSQGNSSPMIAPFWDDLVTTGGGVYKWYDSVNNRFIVEWYNMKNGYNQSSVETFQVILYDQSFYPTSLGDGPIKIQYHTFNNVDVGYHSDPGYTNGNYATVGIQNRDQTSGLGYSFNNLYPTAAAPINTQSATQPMRALYITTAPVFYYTPQLVYDSAITLDNNNNIVEPGETIDLNVSLLNIGELTATNISVVLSTSDPYVTVVSDTSSYASIAGNARGVNISPYRFTVSPTCPDKHAIPFLINITTETNSWSREFNVTVEKPSLIYYSSLVSDTLGNNNGVADPGEAVTLIINAKNKSLVDAYELFGTLSTTYAGVTINSPVLSKPRLSPDEIVQFAYSVTLDNTILPGSVIPFTFNLVSGNTATVNQSVSVICGSSGSIMDFESFNGNLQSQSGWQYGAPVQTTPHSGSNLWCTNLTGQYPNNAMFILKTPVITLGENATLSFWHRMACQNYSDGGNVSISTNGGDTWTLLYPTAGYNTPYSITALGEVGYTGSVSWAQVNFNLSTYAGNDVILRWRFGSNASTQGDGWFIDDMMISGYFIKPGIVTGTVSLNSETSPSLTKVIVQNKFMTYPDSTGAYALYLPAGTYEITASLPYHIAQTSPSFEINNLNLLFEYNFGLYYLPAPTTLTAVSPYGQSTVTLNWIAPEETDYVITGYNIYRKYLDHPYQMIGQSATATYSETLTLGGTYYYYVRAVYSEGEGAPTDDIIVGFPFVGNGMEPTPAIVNALYANYPNPFNPTTTVAYSLAKAGNVYLRIYNTKGQLVRTLDQGSKKSGQYKIIWNGLNDAGKPVSSGLYFFRLDTPGYSSTKKMMMLK